MKADYGLAVAESIKVLQDHNYCETPISLSIIFEALKRTIKLCSYTNFSDKSGLSITEICAYFDSELGACAYNKKKEHYVIYYNDTKANIGLSRFTIAHELGHIFLKHHHKTNTDILHREGISAIVYKQLENEANCFARNLLSPHPLVTLVTDISSSNPADDIMRAFNISYDAAKTRWDFYKHDGYRINKSHKDYFKKYTIHYGYYCLNCNSAEAEHSKYCKICGEKDSVFEKGVDRLIYNDGVELAEDMKVLRCPQCDNEELSINAKYCKICGMKAYNYCLGEEICDYNGNTQDIVYHINSSNARFCETCGNKTDFFNLNLLKSWEDYKREMDEMLD